MVGSELVDAMDFMHGLFRRKMLFSRNALASKGCIGRNEHMESLRAVFQNHIRASPYDDARPFVGSMADDAALGHKQTVVGRKTLVDRHQVIHPNIFPDALEGGQTLIVCLHITG